MTRTRWILLTAIVAALTLLGGATWAQEPAPAAPAAALGTAFTYQGQLKSDGEPVTGTCDMEFRLYADANGTAQVGDLVSVPVSIAEGYFTAELGFGSGAFDGEARWLGIQVQCPGDPGMVNLGLQALTAAPYALSAPWSGLSGVPAGFADNVDNNTTYSAGTGLDLEWGTFGIEEPFQLPGGCSQGAPAEFNSKTERWECGIDASGWQPGRVVLVAKSGGDYSSIQAAIDSITTAAESNPYLVWVAPGVYEEQVTMEPYVHLQGAGQEATIIRSDEGETLYLAGHTSLRDLTVVNVGNSIDTHAIWALASDNVTGTLLADVTARGQGTGPSSHAIFLRGSDTSVTLLDVTAQTEGGSQYNFGLHLQNAATAILQGGSFTASGGQYTYAIYSEGTGSTLEATDVSALAENVAVGATVGLKSYNGTVILHGGTFAAHGGEIVWGISNSGSEAILEAGSVTAEGLDGTNASYGLSNTSGASATLHDGSFTSRGGSARATGVNNSSSETVLKANGISALAMGSTYSRGFDTDNYAGACITHSVLEGSYGSADGNEYTEIAHSRLLGGAVTGSLDMTCVAVSWNDTFYANTCP